MLIKSAVGVKGTLTLPGDKSISHRAAMLASLASGRTRISNYASSADCSSTLGCMSALSVPVERESSAVVIDGVGRQGLQRATATLDCGNSGTTMRLLAGILAGQDLESVLIGDSSLSKRPMKRVIDPLELMGASVTSEDGHAPLRIIGRRGLKAADHNLTIASAQIKSCILLAALNADGITTVREPATTRDHTERMLRWFGVDVESYDGTISVRGGQDLVARDIVVPGDVSAAAFFMVAAACLNDSDLLIENVGLNPTRTGIIDVLARLGVNLNIIEHREECGEPVGDIIVRPSSGDLGGPENLISGSLVANLIDEIPILAILGTQLDGGLEIRDAAELRVKESDRIASVVTNLRLMGATVDEFPDGFKVHRSELHGARVDSFDDHRIAMAFTIAGLLARGDTYIDRANCVDISFPEFYAALAKLAVRSETER